MILSKALLVCLTPREKAGFELRKRWG